MGHLDALSEDSRRRLELNPLRILDSKDAGDRRLLADAPKFDDYLNALSKDFFAGVTAGLDSLGIRYQRNPHLVRGFDYYCHSAFEFVTDARSEEHTSELQSLMRHSYAVFCLKKK